MSITTTTHLNFRGDARAALEFYRSVFGGEITIATHRQGYGTTDPAEADLVAWGQVLSANGFHVMAFDVPASQSYDAGDKPVYVSVRGTDQDELTACWKGLSDGATVIQDLGPSGWTPLYGMLKDRFGVTWVIDVAVAY
ncbi:MULTISPECIES: VOC family protein [Catenuloplanes]|uniref:PhnB protein n=1 Tax=Catenuloplanes niger TaxID=587534 RepID=A0AAE3ZL92_9ACTN|nr:VOC family protein [Catenuloplanes niger]MDR7320228.1 PhnB protein [Catenuloplanes niger]